MGAFQVWPPRVAAAAVEVAASDLWGLRETLRPSSSLPANNHRQLEPQQCSASPPARAAVAALSLQAPVLPSLRTMVDWQRVGE